MDDDDDKSDKFFLDSDEDLNFSDVHHEPTKGKKKAIKVSPFFPLGYLFVVYIGHLDTKSCQNIQKLQKGDFRRDVNNAHTNSAIPGNTAINSIAKMKLSTAQKQKEPLDGSKSW